MSIVVSGTGVVGLCAAINLARLGHQVTVVGRNRPKYAGGKFQVGLRTLALNELSLNLLRTTLGDVPLDFTPVKHIEVWEDGGTGFIHMDRDEVSSIRLAGILDQAKLIEVLCEIAENELEVRWNSPIEAIANTGEIELAGGSKLQPSLLIVCEGTRSHTCTLARVVMTRTALRQHALATIIRSEQPHENYAVQRFTDTPCALLPLADPNLHSLIWTIPTTRIQEHLALSDHAFCSRAAQALGRRFGEFVDVDKRVAFPLVHQIVDSFFPRDNLLVIGDSAHTIHPLAGQGTNLGMEDVSDMLDLFVKSAPGVPLAIDWRLYSSRRRMRARSFMLAMRFFSEVWQVRDPYLRWLRNFGVRTVNELAPLKRLIIRQAMGTGFFGCSK